MHKESKVIIVNDTKNTFTYDIPLDYGENSMPLFFNLHNRDSLTPIRVLVFYHQKFVADLSRKLTLFKPSFTTNWKSAVPSNKMLCNMNGGVPNLDLKPIEILCILKVNMESNHYALMNMYLIYRMASISSIPYGSVRFNFP
jgi:hypothetical protein